ncbi:dihydrolipoamide dehydrogenase [Cyclobacterium lianum]|uniref:Dihydrolipoamide dehydrogenase n=1 Tax=Cyclobacterium lianum TaxID=388280 RepID=A0A1M7KCZ1_9BACT|nr:mercuric reductase [Cyclobacterium lianum]SHM63094.1 dihydrolipoamide dehydrogenase [Cyclobacterium lianum]
MKKYHSIVIGAGQSGMPLAKKISAKGFSVALIEKRALGGTCINDGCSPTKTMVASAKVAHMVSRASEFGVEVKGFRVNQKAVRDRKNRIVELFRGGATKGLQKAENLDIIMGEGVFQADKTLLVKRAGQEDLVLQAEKYFINTGSAPNIPPIEGLGECPYLDSTSIMELEETPEHLIVLGGGYIGLEFGQMFSRFGSKVTIMDMAPRLVPKEDEDVCQEISDIFAEEKINTIFNVDVKKAGFQNGYFTLHYQGKKGAATISGSHLLVATGRKPSSEHLGLEAAGVKLGDKGHILVDDNFETNVPGIYALGDVAGSPPFTHMAYHDAHIAFNRIFEENLSLSAQDRLVPYCVFTDPQLARIGWNEQQAKERGIPYKTGKFWMKHAGRALETDETKGFFKVLVDPKNKQIIGATTLSKDGGEIMAVLQMAMVGKVPYDQIQHLPIAHPTLAESLNNLMGQVETNTE